MFCNGGLEFCECVLYNIPKVSKLRPPQNLCCGAVPLLLSVASSAQERLKRSRTRLRPPQYAARSHQIVPKHDKISTGHADKTFSVLFLRNSPPPRATFERPISARDLQWNPCAHTHLHVETVRGCVDARKNTMRSAVYASTDRN